MPFECGATEEFRTHSDITPRTLLKTSTKPAIIGLILSSPQTFDRRYHIGHLLRLGFLPAISARAHLSTVFYEQRFITTELQPSNFIETLQIRKHKDDEVHYMYTSVVLASQKVQYMKFILTKTHATLISVGYFLSKTYANIGQKNVLSEKLNSLCGLCKYMILFESQNNIEMKSR